MPGGGGGNPDGVTGCGGAPSWPHRPLRWAYVAWNASLGDRSKRMSQASVALGDVSVLSGRPVSLGRGKEGR